MSAYLDEELRTTRQLALELNEENSKLRKIIADLEEVKIIREQITDALEAAGYFHMSNGKGIASICAELQRLKEAEARRPTGAET